MKVLLKVVYMCVYVYVYMYSVYVYVYMYMCICICAYVYVCMYMCICMCVYVHVYMYVCICMCVYAYKQMILNALPITNKTIGAMRLIFFCMICLQGGQINKTYSSYRNNNVLIH